MQQFLGSIEKFSHKLGPQASRGIHHGTFAKIHWSQSVATKVKQLRKTVHLQTSNIQMLLSLLIQHNQTLDRTLFTSTFAKHLAAIESLATQVKSIEMTLRQNREAADEQVVDAFQHASQSSQRSVDKSSTEKCDDVDKSTFYTSAVSHNKSPLAEQTRKVLSFQTIQGKLATSDEVRTLKNSIGSCSPHPNPTSGTSSASGNTEQHPHSLMMLIQNMLADNLPAMFDFLNSRLNVIPPHVLRFSNDFLLSLPHVSAFLRVLRQIPRAVSLVLEDNIRFEDALGRMQSLQYQHFRHWLVFEACLRYTFNNTPGMQKVLQGQFVLTCHGAAEEVLDAKNWEKYASPGMAVTMSISMSTILTPRGLCPRGCVAKRTAVSGSEARCTGCDLIFSVRHPPEADILPTLKFMGAGSRPRVLRTPRRLRRPESVESERQKRQMKRDRSESAADHLGDQLNIYRTEVSNLIRYHSAYKEKEEHQLEMQEITHFKRVHLVEDTALKWTWVFSYPYKPWYWGWCVDLPEVRAEWKTAEFWEAISPGPEERWKHYSGEADNAYLPLHHDKARELASQFSQDPPPHPTPLFQRTYTPTYGGSQSLSDSHLVLAKIPFIHLLAIQPLTPSQIRNAFAMPPNVCDQLLSIFAIDCPTDPDKKELRNEAYRELDVWGFPYHKQIRREAAINRSIHAFDILRIGRQDNLWQTLLPPEQRGKGICLSKRNLD